MNLLGHNSENGENKLSKQIVTSISLPKWKDMTSNFQVPVLYHSIFFLTAE